MPGVRHNLRHRFEAWSLGVPPRGLTDTARGLLLYTVAQICRARVTGEPVLEATEDLMEATRAALAPLHRHGAGRPAPRARTTRPPMRRMRWRIARLVAEMLNADGRRRTTRRAGDATPTTTSAPPSAC